MKALILAAGYGTRLKPHTDLLPKPLFPLGGITLLDKIIRDLAAAGCDEALVNTHHLADKIATHIRKGRYPIPIETRYEAEILGTGGAIANAADFLDGHPFLVINSDIVTDIDLAKVYSFHLSHPHPVTMVLVDHPAFNSVSLDRLGFINGFNVDIPILQNRSRKTLTFTGIQVLDADVLDFFPKGKFSSSITAYGKMLSSDLKIKAYQTTRHRWRDIGTPERYKRGVMDIMTRQAFDKRWPDRPDAPIQRTVLKGDGSDRMWYRVIAGGRSLILVDHGIRHADTACEAAAFIDIGRHLFREGIPVPEIVLADPFSGVVIMEDLGDLHFQDRMRSIANPKEVATSYRRVIDRMILMSHRGGVDFNPGWTWQTTRYDRTVVIDHECRYFVDAFLNGYLGLKFRFEDLAGDFDTIAEGATSCATEGFMHRDFQSRNIMVTGVDYFFIDFQGGRIGPIQYDLASLLIDPYVGLPMNVQRGLINYTMERLALTDSKQRNRFLEGYHWCALSRNLQILGAFSYLSRVKGKKDFEQYIPSALITLKERLTKEGYVKLNGLNRIASAL